MQIDFVKVRESLKKWLIDGGAQIYQENSILGVGYSKNGLHTVYDLNLYTELTLCELTG